MLKGMMMMEEEFEIKDDEPWFDKQDLEHDLQLAAELGKSLLERNRELEQGLGQMYSTNQEQLQEIEYLTKQVELLRQVNDQHAKVYEQLDCSARDLEQSNHKLSLENRGAQQKIQGLTETVDLLQSQLEELQQQVEDMKISSKLSGRPRGRQSISCLQELDSTYRWTSSDLPDSLPSSWCWHEEEKEALRESLRSLQAQFASERSRRERAEREAEALANENAALEQQLGALENCKTRLTELERESEELRQLWRLRSGSQSSALHDLSFFMHDAADDPDSDPAPKQPRLLKRCVSERLLVPPSSHDDREDDGEDAGEDAHACSCARRHHEAFRHRGISLFTEVDAQYSALQLKYDELLRSCQQEVPREDEKRAPREDEEQQRSPPDLPLSPEIQPLPGDTRQPEYKELFRKIFQRIQKTKEDLKENRGGARGRDLQ